MDVVVPEAGYDVLLFGVGGMAVCRWREAVNMMVMRGDAESLLWQMMLAHRCSRSCG